jgi:hypothetical protein
LQFKVTNYVETYLDDLSEVNPVIRLRRKLKDASWVWRKSIVRAIPGMKVSLGNHKALFGNIGETDQIKVAHFPYRSEGQFVNKIINGSRSMAISNVPENQGTHWRLLGKMYEKDGEGVLHSFYRDNLYADEHRIEETVEDPAFYMGGVA